MALALLIQRAHYGLAKSDDPPRAAEGDQADLAALPGLEADGETLLSAEERDKFDADMARLRGLLDSADGDAIKLLTEQLGRDTESFAARRMDRSIQQALAGKSVESLDVETSE